MNDRKPARSERDAPPSAALEQAGSHPLGTAAGAAGGAAGGAEESVAGEEDPGASIDLAMPPGGATPQNPGDEAPAGSPGTGESVCSRCGGSGRLGDAPCPDCGGTGKVVQGIGGA